MTQESAAPMDFGPVAGRAYGQLDHALEPAPSADALRVIGGRYELLDQIGEGGAAHVYRARDRVLDRIVAVKELRAEYGSDEDFVDRFYREARSVASLSHPNIVDIYDYGSDNDRHFIVMQYIEGSDLKTILRREGRLPPARAVALVSGALRGLAAAHDRGIIHRDVKPQNLLVRSPDGLVKLTDFGVARALGAARQTAAGITFGTAHYMAPEQAAGREVGPAADLYAAGVVLYEALAGRVPFDGDTPLAITAQHLHAPLPSLIAIVPGVPPALARVVERSLAKDPDARYPTADALRRAIAAAAGDSPVGVYGHGFAPRVQPKAIAQQSDAVTTAIPTSAPVATIAEPARRAQSGTYGCVLSFAGAVVMALLLGFFALTRGGAEGGRPSTTPMTGGAPSPSGAVVAIPEPTATLSSPTATISQPAAISPEPTATAAPPTATSESSPSPSATPPATETTVPPTATVPPPPKPTTAPPRSAPRTPTPVPPTDTPEPPTTTPVPPTSTTVPPTATMAPPSPTRTLPPPPPVATQQLQPTPQPEPTQAPEATQPPQGAVPSGDFSPYQLQGTYKRDDGTLYGLPAVALYGRDSGYSEGTFTFQLRDRPDGQLTILFTGLDDERAEHCQFQVIVNGRIIFDAPTTFPNVPNGDIGVGGKPRYWGQMTITLPADTLKEGRNTITLRNRAQGNRPGVPYILIHNLEFRAD